METSARPASLLYYFVPTAIEDAHASQLEFNPSDAQCMFRYRLPAVHRTC